jgi:hypothetical protein
MTSKSRRSGILISLVVALVSALGLLYYIIFPGWVKKQIHDLPFDIENGLAISVEKINATALPIGLRLKNVSIHQLSSDSTIIDSLFIHNITLRQFNLISFLFTKKYKVDHITLDHLTGEWTMSADDTTKVELIVPFNASCKTFTLEVNSLTLKKKNTDLKTRLEKGSLNLKNIRWEKDSSMSSITYNIGSMDFISVHRSSSDSLYTYRAHDILYSDRDSILTVDSFYSIPNLENYAFAQAHPYQTDRIEATFKNIICRGCDLDALISEGDLRISSIHIDTFLLDIFRDRRRPFLHKNRPLFQDLLYLYPGVLSVDSVIAHNGKIIFTEHDLGASEPGIIWFSDVEATVQHLYNDTSVHLPHDTFIVAAQALAMGKGNIEFESKGHIRDPQNTFVFNGHMEKIPVAAFNPMFIPNAALEAEDGYVHGIYFNFIADHRMAHGDLLLRYQDLRLLKVDKETSASKGLKNRLLTRVLNRKILDHNPLPGDTLRDGTIQFERDPEKMYFWYMFKSIFSGIRETVMK